jgi:hemoglobin-like flavoprotein
MTPQQVFLIRKSFAELSRHDHIAALIFYRRLFEIDPSLRPMFVTDIEEQSKKLIDMLGALIAMIEQPLGLDVELRAMGARHAGYGVTAEHYVTVGTALLDMLGEVLGAMFTPDTCSAWMVLYGAVASAMKTGARGVGPPAMG